MPALTPISLWEQTGRVQAFGDVLIQFAVRRQNRKVQMALGPTHEEVVTDLVSRHVSSYRQMPITLYQIQTKFRNEERPRFGVLRTSEFLMKDAYSFDVSVEALEPQLREDVRGLLPHLRPLRAALPGRRGRERADRRRRQPRIHGPGRKRRGRGAALPGLRLRGQPGAGGDRRPRPGAARRAAEAARPRSPRPAPAPSSRSASSSAASREQMIKTLIYLADGKPIAVLVRGDHDANEGKIRRAAGAAKIELADPATIERVTGAPVGLRRAGRHEGEDPHLADRDVAADGQRRHRGQRGRHAPDGREPRAAISSPTASPTSATPSTATPARAAAATLALRHAIEVGHVFKLGTKYSEALGARFLDQNEQLRPIIMGCYGIGINRIIAALIETTHDENGIIWPVSLAPYEVLLAPVKVTDPATKQAADAPVRRACGRRHRGAAGRPRRAGRREVQGRRPGGHSAPRGHRRARPEGRQAGNQVALGQAGRDDRPATGPRNASSKMIVEERADGKRFANRTRGD